MQGGIILQIGPHSSQGLAFTSMSGAKKLIIPVLLPMTRNWWQSLVTVLERSRETTACLEERDHIAHRTVLLNSP